MKRAKSRSKIQTPPDAASVASEAARIGKILTEAEAELLATYLLLLTEWGGRMNLVGPGDWRHWLENLVADSWRLAEFLEKAQKSGLLVASPRSLDLGAGAGLPGIPLRVFWRSGDYALVEAREKRSIFLRVALSRLGLPRTTVHGVRVENLPESVLPVDLVLSRAFMPWPSLLPLAAGLLSPSGAVVVMANEPAPEEAKSVSGLVLADQVDYPAPGGQRYFWLFIPESISR